MLKRVRPLEWLICVGIVVFFASIFVPMMTVCACADTKKQCLTNAKQMGLHLIIYANDWDDCLPASYAWMDAVETLKAPRLKLRDPLVRQESGYGYAFNSELSSFRMTAIDWPSQTPLVYDSSNLGRNATDPYTSLPKPGRHWDTNTTSYSDSHVMSTK